MDSFSQCLATHPVVSLALQATDLSSVLVWEQLQSVRSLIIQQKSISAECRQNFKEKITVSQSKSQVVSPVAERDVSEPTTVVATRGALARLEHWCMSHSSESITGRHLRSSLTDPISNQCTSLNQQNKSNNSNSSQTKKNLNASHTSDSELDKCFLAELNLQQNSQSPGISKETSTFASNPMSQNQSEVVKQVKQGYSITKYRLGAWLFSGDTLHVSHSDLNAVVPNSF